MCSVELAESRQVSEPKSEVSRKVSGARGEQSEAEELKSQRDREHTISGDYSLRVPPVPIPNTEVKPQHADGTWLETARESRSSPDSTGAVKKRPKKTKKDLEPASGTNPFLCGII